MVGGGITGLATATALLKSGWTVTVAERQPVISEVGAGILVSRNGLAALTALGLADRVRDVGHPVAVTGQRDHRGRWLMRQRRDDPRFAGLNRGVGVHRKRLLAVLEEGARSAGARILLGAAVTDVRPGDPAGARAEVTWRDQSGGEVGAGTDLVVVADGVGSTFRDRLVPGAVISYSGKTCWRAVTDDSRLVGDDFLQLWGPHAEFGAVRIGAGQVYWFGYVVGLAQREYDDELAAAAERFAGWSAGVPELIAATRPDQLMRHDVVHLPGGAPRYAAGRAVLAGDAAHALVPTMGQGANLSLEDAATIGSVIDGRRPLGPAIAEYDAVRGPRARTVARQSELTGRLGADLGPGLPQLLRNAAARLVPTRFMINTANQVTGWTP